MKGNPQPPRRSEPIPVKQVVWDAVLDFTGGDADIEFAIKDIKPVALEKYPNFNVSNVSAEINADCVNSPSRHHYSGNEDRYWRVGHGIYRLYNPEKDNEERITSMKGNPQPPRRSEPIPVKQVVWDAVLDFTGGDADIEFAIRDIKPVVLKKYPNFNVSNVDAEINADCVNSPSRHHFSRNEDRYWRVKYGKYRLYNPEKDKVECDGERNP